jgi:mono/diheme cytochrome c family protein
MIFTLNRIKIVATLAAFAGSAMAGTIDAQQAGDAWIAPEEAKALKNPVQATIDSVHQGQGLYEENCMACHGAKGKGDGPTASFRGYKASDLTHAEAAAASDGEVFWKISTGKSPMKGYENDLTEEERWHLVNYVRTLAQADEAEKPAHAAPANEAKNDRDHGVAGKVEDAAQGSSLHSVPQRAAESEEEVMTTFNQKPWLILSLVGSVVLGAFFAIIGSGAPPPAAHHDEAHGHH